MQITSGCQNYHAQLQAGSLCTLRCAVYELESGEHQEEVFSRCDKFAVAEACQRSPRQPLLSRASGTCHRSHRRSASWLHFSQPDFRLSIGGSDHLDLHKCVTAVKEEPVVAGQHNVHEHGNTCRLPAGSRPASQVLECSTSLHLL